MLPLSLLTLTLTLTALAPADVSFENRADDFGLALPAKRAVWGDLDGDGWLDAILDGSRVLMSRPADAPQGGGRRFVDTTAASGINRHPTDPTAERRASFVLLGDVDGDGDLDLFSARSCDPEKWKPDPENKEEPLRDASGERVSAWIDYGLRSEILVNDGSGRFTILADSGVSRAETTACAAFLDYDLDGRLDLFVGNWYRSYGWSYDAYPDRLYRGLGNGRFEEVTEAAGLLTRDEAGHRDSSRPTYGVTSGDVDSDGWPDLFVCAYGRQWNLLWLNQRDGTFREVGATTGFDGDAERSGVYPAGIDRAKEDPFRANGNTFDCALADFDDDGDLDAFLAAITHAWAGPSSDRSSLLINTPGPVSTTTTGGDADGTGFHFERTNDARGITRTHTRERWNQGDLHATWIDAGGDGRLDLVIASGDYPDDQRLRLFRQEASLFEDVTSDVGLNWEGCGGLSVGDADGDGDPDILIGRSLARLSKETRAALGKNAALWIQRSAAQTRWLKVRLRGQGAGGTNTFGLGCRVTVIHADGRRHGEEIRGGEGHHGHQNPPELTFGCGAESFVDLEIRWATAPQSVTRLGRLPTGTTITIREGSPTRVEIHPLEPASEG